MFLFYKTLWLMIVHLIAYSKCYGDPEIRPAVDSNNKNNIFYAEAGKKLKIIFQNISAERVECRNANNARQKCSILFSDPYELDYNNFYWISIHTVTKIEAYMFTKWNCTVFDYNGINPVTYEFYLQNSNIRRQYAQVKIGERTLDFTDKNTAIYDYIDGETIDWGCSMTDNGHLKFIYYDSKGIPLFNSAEIHEQNYKFGYVLRFQQLMTASHNNSYVHCNYIKSDGHFEDFNYITIFNMKTEIANDDSFSDDFVVKINNVNLLKHQSQCNDLNSNIYEYTYIYGEELTVFCEKKKNKGILGIIVECFNKSILREDYISTDLLHRKIKTKQFDDDCQIIIKSDHGNYQKGVKIYLYRETKREPVILGLRADNILYQYTKDEYEWITHYEYSQSEIINLTCSRFDRNRVLKFIVNGKELNSSTLISNASLLDNITCESVRQYDRTRRMTVQFQPKPFLKFTYGIEGNPNIMYVGIAIGTLSVIIIIIYAIYWYKYKFVKKENHFEIFNNEDTTIPAFPRQWESNDYTYIETSYNHKPYGITLENSMYYSSIQSTRNSNIYTENHYNEIDDNFRSYPNTNYPTLPNATYSKTNANNSTNYENQNVIRNKTFVINNDNFNLQRENLSETYGNLQSDPTKVGYSNILSDSSKRYVNFHPKDSSTSNRQKY